MEFCSKDGPNFQPESCNWLVLLLLTAKSYIQALVVVLPAMHYVTETITTMLMVPSS